MSLLMFVAEYGPLFWAEKYVPSGVVSVLAATIPIITLVLEMVVLRQQTWNMRLAACDSAGVRGRGRSAAAERPTAFSGWCRASQFCADAQRGRWERC